MIFKPELAAKVLSSEKTVTRRPVKAGKPCAYLPGRSYAVQVPQTEGPGKGRGGKALGRIAVVSVEHVPNLRSITEAEAVREGFERTGRGPDDTAVAAFMRYWRVLYGDVPLVVPVWRIEFSLIHPDDYPLWENAS